MKIAERISIIETKLIFIERLLYALIVISLAQYGMNIVV